MLKYLSILLTGFDDVEGGFSRCRGELEPSPFNQGTDLEGNCQHHKDVGMHSNYEGYTPGYQ
jgi:hypothetical protein